MVGKRGLASLALTLIVACGAATPTTSSSATPGGTTAATAAATTTPSAVTGTARPTASGPQLGTLLSAGRTAQYKITYNYTLSGAGGMTGLQSWYAKPPKSRFDFTSSFGGQTTAMSFFTIADGTFFCMVVGTTNTCFKAGAGMPNPMDSNPAAQLQQQMMANPSAFGGVFVENKTYAGQSGACYDVTATAPPSTGRFCYTSGGILLYQNFTVSGSAITLEATNFSATVPDSDFELPARPSN